MSSSAPSSMARTSPREGRRLVLVRGGIRARSVTAAAPKSRNSISQRSAVNVQRVAADLVVRDGGLLLRFCLAYPAPASRFSIESAALESPRTISCKTPSDFSAFCVLCSIRLPRSRVVLPLLANAQAAVVLGTTNRPGIPESSRSLRGPRS